MKEDKNMNSFPVQFFLWDYWHDARKMKFYIIFQTICLQTKETTIYFSEIDVLC